MLRRVVILLALAAAGVVIIWSIWGIEARGGHELAGDAQALVHRPEGPERVDVVLEGDPLAEAVEEEELCVGGLGEGVVGGGGEGVGVADLEGCERRGAGRDC